MGNQKGLEWARILTELLCRLISLLRCLSGDASGCRDAILCVSNLNEMRKMREQVDKYRVEEIDGLVFMN